MSTDSPYVPLDVDVPPDLLDIIDKLAKHQGMNRLSFVNIVMRHHCESAIGDITHYNLNDEDGEFFEKVLEEPRSPEFDKLMNMTPVWKDN